MRQIICNQCKQPKKEIEFEYQYFRNKYKHVCRDCDGYKRPLDMTVPKLNKIQNSDPGEESEKREIREQVEA